MRGETWREMKRHESRLVGENRGEKRPEMRIEKRTEKRRET